LAEPARGFAAGAVGMASGRALGAGNIAGENEAEDLLVLGPD